MATPASREYLCDMDNEEVCHENWKIGRANYLTLLIPFIIVALVVLAAVIVL